MILKVDRRTGIIFNPETNNAVGFIGKVEPEYITWCDDDELVEARVHIAMGGRIVPTTVKETTL